MRALCAALLARAAGDAATALALRTARGAQARPAQGSRSRRSGSSSISRRRRRSSSSTSSNVLLITYFVLLTAHYSAGCRRGWRRWWRGRA